MQQLVAPMPVRARCCRLLLNRRVWGWLVLLWALPVLARAQQVLVKGNVAEDTVRTLFGPNRRYFAHAFSGGGLVLGPAGGAGAQLRYGLPSNELELGGRLKRRISQTVALTVAARYNLLTYGLAQTNRKTVPTPTLHLKESLRLHQFSFESGVRLNAGRRGSVIGRYLDLLAWGGWVAATSHLTEDKPAANAGVSTTETTERGLSYMARWPAGLGVRLGTGRVALTGRYRLTSTFKGSGTSWPELPRGVLGLEIGLF